MSVFESFDAATERKIESVGLWVGFAAFGLLAVAIYAVDRYFSEQLGPDVSYFVLYVPAFFAILVVPLVKNAYVRVARRRLCIARGHILYEFDANHGRHVVMCKRCSAMLVGPPSGSHSAKREGN